MVVAARSTLVAEAVIVVGSNGDGIGDGGSSDDLLI